MVKSTSISTEDAEEFTRSLGHIGGGFTQQIFWAWKQGIPAALGLSVEVWVRDRLGGYMKLSVEQRREAVAQLTAEGLSLRAIGAILGVDNVTVLNDQKAIESATAENSAGSQLPDTDIAENSAVDEEASEDEIPQSVDELTPEQQEEVDAQVKKAEERPSPSAVAMLRSVSNLSNACNDIRIAFSRFKSGEVADEDRSTIEMWVDRVIECVTDFKVFLDTDDTSMLDEALRVLLNEEGI